MGGNVARIIDPQLQVLWGKSIFPQTAGKGRFDKIVYVCVYICIRTYMCMFIDIYYM